MCDVDSLICHNGEFKGLVLYKEGVEIVLKKKNPLGFYNEGKAADNAK